MLRNPFHNIIIYNRKSIQQPVPSIDNSTYSLPEYTVSDESKCTTESDVKCYANPVYKNTVDLEKTENIYEALD